MKKSMKLTENLPGAEEETKEPTPGADDDRQVSIPGLEVTDKANNVTIPLPEEETSESSQGSEQEGNEDDTKEKTTKKKGWGEVVILEKVSLPVDTEGKNFMDAYIDLDKWDVETGSTADAEKWLIEMLEKGEISEGLYIIDRRVKTVRLKEVRQVTLEEV